MTTNITLAKGTYSVTIQTITINENYKNQLKPLAFPTTKQKQELGPKDAKVMDMLKITHTLAIKGAVTSTSDRNDLISMFKGAGVSGQPATLTYSSHPDTPLYVFPEQLAIIENSKDTAPANEYKYEVSLTLLEGISM